MTSREKFEAWAKKEKLGIAYGDCGYVFSSTEMAWRAWQSQNADMTVQLANAESRGRELAAENAGLKNPDNWLSQSDYGYEASEVATQNGATEDEPLRAGMIAIINRIGTPATDAFLAEVRAQGVEMFADHLLCPDLDDTIRDFAAQLRKGGNQ